MLLISCPFCGERGEAEFAWGGEPVARPSFSATDAEWGDYLYNRTNVKGRIRELWRHAGGCGQWFVMERDTVTHEIFGTVRVGA